MPSYIKSAKMVRLIFFFEGLGILNLTGNFKLLKWTNFEEFVELHYFFSLTLPAWTVGQFFVILI